MEWNWRTVNKGYLEQLVTITPTSALQGYCRSLLVNIILQGIWVWRSYLKTYVCNRFLTQHEPFEANDCMKSLVFRTKVAHEHCWSHLKGHIWWKFRALWHFFCVSISLRYPHSRRLVPSSWNWTHYHLLTPVDKGKALLFCCTVEDYNLLFWWFYWFI